ncbi:MAG: flagellar motor protein MotD [Burkholderiales bacterium]
MARKPYVEEHDNPDRWLVSYADFMTLLFAFFVVMYAISAVNAGKYKVLSNALGNAFGHTAEVPNKIRENRSISVAPKASLVGVVRQENTQMTRIAKNLLQILAPLVNAGEVRVTQTSRGVNVEINASLLFAPGDAKLTGVSVKALQAIALILKDQRNKLEIDGYTDNTPIDTPQFPSNWELSAVRASSVARAFVADGIAGDRLKVVGYGSNKPILPNDTVAGRARNRRVELVILSNLPQQEKNISFSGK